MASTSSSTSTPFRVLVFDTETTGLSPRKPFEDVEAWAKCRIVQIAWSIHERSGQLIEKQCYTIKPDRFIIPEGAIKVHGISNEEANREGVPMADVVEKLLISMKNRNVGVLVAHNMIFDYNVVQAELWKLKGTNKLADELYNLIDNCERKCTMLMGQQISPNKKWPRLAVLYEQLFGEVPQGCHKADADVEFCSRIYFKLQTTK